MSTFAVYGMTEATALAEARKRTSTIEHGEVLDPETWEQRVRRAVDRILDSKRVKKVSPSYDAPQFAQQFLELARRSRHRDLVIKASMVVKDADGLPVLNKKTGKPKRAWVDYRP